MFDAKRLLDQFLGPNSVGGLQQRANALGQRAGVGNIGSRDVGSAAIGAGLTALLMGAGRGRRGMGIGELGGMAAIGMLAYQGYKKWQAGQGATAIPAMPWGEPPPSGTPFNPISVPEQQSLGRHLLRAMIAAAKSDGHMDAAEQQTVFAQMDKMNLDAADKAFVIDELRAPLDVAAVARGARNPEEAAEIYTASLLAVDVDQPSERAYLSQLAQHLKLDPKLAEHLHATVEHATVTA